MDTSIARRNILARIRAAQGREPEPSASEREAAADYLARHPQGPRPEIRSKH
jgi:L-lactate dehydrogenase complex protein LldG